jgi:hypothetical protein
LQARWTFTLYPETAEGGGCFVPLYRRQPDGGGAPDEQQSLLGPDPPDDPEARLEIVAEGHTRRILADEAEMRAVLRLSLERV